ncbi:hypothetical protein IJG72_04220 [bacterium]|nr:hypothetical protein [bacterium]
MANTNSIINMFNNLFTLPAVPQSAAPKTEQVKAISSNPFNPNLFLSKNTDMSTYAKNRPVAGGYFAGYYNGKPNIVGKKLFIEI